VPEEKRRAKGRSKAGRFLTDRLLCRHLIAWKWSRGDAERISATMRFADVESDV
jgi:hypothetical protein